MGQSLYGDKGEGTDKGCSKYNSYETGSYHKKILISIGGRDIDCLLISQRKNLFFVKSVVNAEGIFAVDLIVIAV